MLRCLLSVAIASSLLLVGCGDDNDFDAVIGSDSATSVKSISSFNTAQINTQFGLDGTATLMPNAVSKSKKSAIRQ